MTGSDAQCPGEIPRSAADRKISPGLAESLHHDLQPFNRLNCPDEHTMRMAGTIGNHIEKMVNAIT